VDGFFSLGAHGPIKEVHIYIYIYIYILVVPSPQLITIPKINAQHFFANYLFIKKQGLGSFKFDFPKFQQL
jgi:hypothetical protein